MPGVYDIYAMLLFLNAATALALILYCWQHWQTPGAKTFFLWMLTTFLWTCSIGLGITSSSEAMAAVWHIRVKLGAVSFMAAFVTLFAFDYTGRREWLRPGVVIAVLTIPVLTQIVLWTQFTPLFARNVRYLYYGSYIFTNFDGGPWWYVHLIYGYGMTLFGLILLLSRIVSGFSMYRWRAVILFAGTLLPVAGSTLTAFDIISYLGIDISAVLSIVVGPLWAWMIFRHQLLDIMPVARDRVFDSVEDAIIVLDIRDTVVDLNPAARSLIRLPKIIGKNVREVFYPYQALIDRYDGVTEARTEIAVPVGKKEQIFDLRISPLYHDHKRLAGRLVVLRDVTERARLIQELDAYAQTVAHDLKTPLTGIIGYVEMLKHFDQQHLSDEMREYIDIIGESGRKMEMIIDELLLMASLRSLDEIAFEPLDMGDIVASAQSRHNHTIRARQVQINQPERWPIARGYAPWIEEVWSNYLSNAIKYGGEPPYIELGAAPQPDGMVRYWVHDNGRGLTTDEQARLFQQFVRLDQTRARGHGLGLSIVRRIIEKQGGKVGVESAVGTGSTFFFTLPSTPLTAAATDAGGS